MVRAILFVGMCFMGQLCLGQENLVVNGSFEDIMNCDISDGQISHANGWYDLFDYITFGPDLYDTCATDPNYNTINNIGGHEIPLDGSAYAGFFVLGAESIAGSLTDNLEKDSIYYFSMGLSLCDECRMATRGLGINFMDSAYTYDVSLFDTISPDLLIDEHVIEKDGWFEFSTMYIAQGFEKFLSIGLYHSPDSLTFLGNQGGVFSSSYYYLDNVILRKATSSEINGIRSHTLEFGLYPNPVRNSVRFDYSGQESPKEITVLSVEGKEVLNTPWQTQMDVSTLPNGLYFLHVQFKDGSVGVERLVVRR